MTTRVAYTLLQAERILWKLLNRPGLNLTPQETAELRQLRCRIALNRSRCICGETGRCKD